MKVRELDESYQVYYSAHDRIVKKVSEDIYETYHITVVKKNKTITINTVEFSELSIERINKHLKSCG